MEEQSHKREMSDAVRADFERLRERGVASSLSGHDAHPPGPPAAEAERSDRRCDDRSLLSRLFRRA
jgi:hypothetical protein